MTSEEARALARKNQSDERFHHTECVAKAAKELAERYGCDVEKARTAAFLHDLLKEWDKDDLLQIIEGSDIIDTETVRACPKVYHAFAGGIYARETLRTGNDVANAVLYHTTGRYGMSLLEKIVFMADYISEDREFRGAEEVREIAQTSLDEACLCAARNLMIHLIKGYKYVNRYSLDAYNYFVGLKGDK